MAPKKKTPKNAFYFFVMDFRERMERRGITYPGGLKEVFVAAGPDWQRLSRQERDRYEAMAKQHKLGQLGTIQKYTTTGKSFQQVDQEMQEKKAEEARMEAEIKLTVAVLDKKGLQLKCFYFMHVNYYCRVEEKQYIPCEMALCQFNFACGAFKLYHTLINPGIIPIGYAFEIKKRSEETHQITHPAPSSAETNYSKILLNIENFMKDDAEDGKLPPIYTHGTDGTPEAVKDVLDTLCENEAFQELPRVHPLPEFFRVYPLPKLFFELRNKAGDVAGKNSKAFPVESLAARELEKNLYSFTPGICCEMHEGTDAGQYCSLSIVKRWSFIIADHCCKDLGIELCPGQHIPPPLKPQHQLPTHAHVMLEKDDKKSAVPSVPSIIDYSRTNPIKTEPLEEIDNDKKLKEPPVPRIIDFSKRSEPPVQKIEPVAGVGRGRPITNFSTVVRKPKSVGLALQGSKCPSVTSEEDFPAIEGLSLKKNSHSKISSNTPPLLSDEDFPAIGRGGQSKSSSTILGEIPVKFAGRGSSLLKQNASPSRGRGIFGLLEK